MRRRAAPLLLFAACSGNGPAEDGPRVQLWHTFSPRETEALNQFLDTYAPAVEPTLLPFSRAQHIVRETLDESEDCPDLVRIDATWLPGLARRKLIHSVPKNVEPRAWLPEAAALASYGPIEYGFPQAIDGLALIYDPKRVATAGTEWPPQTLNDLIAVAHRLTRITAATRGAEPRRLAACRQRRVRRCRYRCSREWR